MNITYRTRQQTDLLHYSLDQISQSDTRIRNIITRIGYPEPRVRAPGFTTLARIIVSQRLSTRAVAAIWERLSSHCHGEVTTDCIAAQSNQQLRQLGLSSQKVQYIKELANAILLEQIDLSHLHALEDEKLIQELTKIKGVGQWSAEVYSIFALDRANMFPAKDLALQHGVKLALQLTEKPDEKTTRQLSERWSPHKSAVTLLLWKLYGSTTLDE